MAQGIPQDSIVNTTTKVSPEERIALGCRKMNRNSFFLKTCGVNFSLTQLHDVALRTFLLALEGQVCIAGGAIRDTILGVPYRDLDIFMTSDVDRQMIEGLAYSNFGVPRVKILNDNGFQSTWELDYRFRFKEGDNTTKLNFIWGNRFEFLEGPSALIKGFDLSMNQFAFTHDSVYYTDKAMLSLMGRKILLCPEFRFNEKSFAKILRFVSDHGFTIDEDTMNQMITGYKIVKQVDGAEYAREGDIEEVLFTVKKPNRFHKSQVTTIPWIPTYGYTLPIISDPDNTA